MYIVLTVRRASNLHHIFFQTAKQHRTIKTFQFPPLTYLKIKLQQCGYAFSGKKIMREKQKAWMECLKKTTRHWIIMGIEKIDTQHIILIAMLLSKNDTMKYSLFLVNKWIYNGNRRKKIYRYTLWMHIFFCIKQLKNWT